MKKIQTEWLFEAMIESEMKQVGFEIEYSPKLVKIDDMSMEKIEDLLLLLVIDIDDIDVFNVFSEEKINFLRKGLLIGVGYDIEEEDFVELLKEIKITPKYL